MEPLKKQKLGIVEEAVALILRIGVYVSMAVVVGSLLAIIFLAPSFGIDWQSSYDKALAHPSAITDPTQWSDLGRALIQGNPFGWMAVGLFLLILTPVLRVAISIWAFHQEKDRLYVGVTSFVLGVLILSFILGTFNL